MTAAGILAPLAGGLGVDPVLIALAAGSGALFVPHVSSNFFWMFQTCWGSGVVSPCAGCSTGTTRAPMVWRPNAGAPAGRTSRTTGC
ncbi:GntP family permease [Amycolatopsis aidingensis]|uniref:GntP family permease n=1 Tax=Amycolatopsis aidingensis TaxID=2842453 RepID=UPI001E33E090|nr:GntP family permease [Amycolatopsis aidingensis]